jgi:hypothetical protein
MVAMENDYHARGVIAFSISDDPWAHISREAVQEAVGQCLGMPHRDIEVEFFPSKGFLVLLPTPVVCD